MPALALLFWPCKTMTIKVSLENYLTSLPVSHLRGLGDQPEEDGGKPDEEGSVLELAVHTFSKNGVRPSRVRYCEVWRAFLRQGQVGPLHTGHLALDCPLVLRNLIA